MHLTVVNSCQMRNEGVNNRKVTCMKHKMSTDHLFWVFDEHKALEIHHYEHLSAPVSFLESGSSNQLSLEDETDVHSAKSCLHFQEEKPEPLLSKQKTLFLLMKH